jgi:hypothetical protein
MIVLEKPDRCTRQGDRQADDDKYRQTNNFGQGEAHTIARA